MNDELVAALERFWGKDPPVKSRRGIWVIEELEKRYDIRIPEDFRTYIVSGAPQEESINDTNFALWSPDQIKSITDECGGGTPTNGFDPDPRGEPGKYLVFRLYALVLRLCDLLF